MRGHKVLEFEALTTGEIHNELVAVYESKVPSISTVKKRMSAFKRGREDLEDDPRSGRPSNACTRYNTEKVLDLVMSARRMTVRQLSTSVGISKDSVVRILNTELGMTKVSARWEPCLLTPEMMRARKNLSRDGLALYRVLYVK